MLIFRRNLERQIVDRLFKGKAILVFGPRQAGKTTLAKTLLHPFGDAGGYYNCELATVRNHLEVGKPELLKELTAGKKIAVLDEAQTVSDIGLILKAFIDTYPEIQIITTGSSSFDLANKINEPLTGRAFEFTLYPLSLDEIRAAMPDLSREDLDEIMRLGSYPAVIAETNSRIREDVLRNLATNYLYKDVYMFESIRNPRVFEGLIRMLALQVGSLVSVNELSVGLGISRGTVEKYLRLLEQSYVIRIVRSFSRNPRNEMKKGFKIFFIDTGIRNAIIDNISPVEGRSDKGAIFENFFVSERLKAGALESFPPFLGFWRSRQGIEIDVIEERAEQITAYECKWSEAESDSFPVFKKSYPNATMSVVNPASLLIGFEKKMI